MRNKGKILIAAVFLSLVLCAEAFAVTAPAGENGAPVMDAGGQAVPAGEISAPVMNDGGQAVPAGEPEAAEAALTPAQKAAAEGKTLLAPPTYVYMADGKIYWGGQTPEIGVSVMIFTGEYTEASVEQEGTFDKDTEDTNIVIKTGKEPVDISRYIRGISAPVFRIRCIPEYSVRKQLAPSEWLEPQDITVDKLLGLGLEGWVYVPGKWYYFVGGVPQKGWYTLGQSIYYFDPATGAMQTGWVYDSRKWYYLDEETGILFKNGITPDGCVVDKDGVWGGRRM